MLLPALWSGHKLTASTTTSVGHELTCNWMIDRARLHALARHDFTRAHTMHLPPSNSSVPTTLTRGIHRGVGLASTLSRALLLRGRWRSTSALVVADLRRSKLRTWYFCLMNAAGVRVGRMDAP
jgi:hypothetical protein